MADRLRGRAGVEQRKRRLHKEPLCRRCAGKGRVTASTVPDHIIPLAQGGTDDDTNIRCLCDECHREVTAEQFGHRLRPTIGIDGWPINQGGG
jgi:5-methylcytosine-specific restriction protein A